MTMFTLTPTEVRACVIDLMAVGLVPFIQSSPGLGKSSIVAQIAKDYELELIDVRLSQCAPEDLMGLPMRRGTDEEARAFFAPFDMFPLVSTPLPKGKKGWILFLDEFNSASKSVQAAAYKPVLDHMIGQAKLSPDCYVVAAGNLSTDRAIVTQMGTAMQSRVVHLEMVADVKGFMKYAYKADWDHRILGFLEFQPSKLHNFKPDHQDRTFACPRTWEFASRICKGKAMEDIKLPLLAGTLSDGIAVELHTFMKEYSNLPRYQKICDEAETLNVPQKASTCYALITSMISSFTPESFPRAVIFARRMSPEFQVIYFRAIVAQHPKMRTNPDYAKNITHLVKFLNEEDTAKAA
jgi:hypothetical protein